MMIDTILDSSGSIDMVRAINDLDTVIFYNEKETEKEENIRGTNAKVVLTIALRSTLDIEEEGLRDQISTFVQHYRCTLLIFYFCDRTNDLVSFWSSFTDHF